MFSSQYLLILTLAFKQYVNRELPDVQAGFIYLLFYFFFFTLQYCIGFAILKLVLEKGEELEIKLPTSSGSWKKQESSRKTSISSLLTMPKPLTVWITINCGRF